MVERNFLSWNRTLSVDTDSFESWEITLKVGTVWNRNLQVVTQHIDDGRGSWKLEYVGTRRCDIRKNSGTSIRIEYGAVCCNTM